MYCGNECETGDEVAAQYIDVDHALDMSMWTEDRSWTCTWHCLLVHPFIIDLHLYTLEYKALIRRSSFWFHLRRLTVSLCFILQHDPPPFNSEVEILRSTFQSIRNTSPKPLKHSHQLSSQTIQTTFNRTNPFRTIQIKHLALYSRSQ